MANTLGGSELLASSNPQSYLNDETVTSQCPQQNQTPARLVQCNSFITKCFSLINLVNMVWIIGQIVLEYTIAICCTSLFACDKNASLKLWFASEFAMVIGRWAHTFSNREDLQSEQGNKKGSMAWRRLGIKHTLYSPSCEYNRTRITAAGEWQVCCQQERGAGREARTATGTSRAPPLCTPARGTWAQTDTHSLSQGTRHIFETAVLPNICFHISGRDGKVGRLYAFWHLKKIPRNPT